MPNITVDYLRRLEGYVTIPEAIYLRRQDMPRMVRRSATIVIDEQLPLERARAQREPLGQPELVEDPRRPWAGQALPSAQDEETPERARPTIDIDWVYLPLMGSGRYGTSAPSTAQPQPKQQPIETGFAKFVKRISPRS